MRVDNHCVPSLEEFKLASRRINNEVLETELYIADLNCGACVNKLEKQLTSLDSVLKVRANLTKKRVAIQWYASRCPSQLLDSINKLGFSATLIDEFAESSKAEIKPYLRALAVAGFAASNVMLLSVAVWSGADESTRQLFHWISAAIALPAIVYSGRVFFESAWLAVSHGRTNMDVPVSVGIILSVLLGVYDTINQHEAVYFEAATMLVFFLLIGRTLDKLMRARADSSVDGLRALEPRGAYVVDESGAPKYTASKDLRPGDRVVVKAGDRIPVDGVIVSGDSLLDTAIVDGESQTKKGQPGLAVFGGTLNIASELIIEVTANLKDSFLAQMHSLVQSAQTTKGHYTQIADRVARWYAPLVHTAAVIAFLLWVYLSGDIHKSLTVAISVLIITCPCALALAVPMVHVMAGSQLLNRGIIMKDGASLEKLSDIGSVVFDKTGTLTTDAHVVGSIKPYTDEQLLLAVQMAQESEHPYAKALLKIAQRSAIVNVAKPDKVVDVPGCGLEVSIDGKTIRLGRREWAAFSESKSTVANSTERSEAVLGCDGKLLAVFRFSDELRVGAKVAIERIRGRQLKIAMISGDQLEPTTVVANQLAITDAHAKALPKDKVLFVQSISLKNRVLMVGDGVNDSGAMAAAHVAMAPGTAASVGRNIADFIFIREDLNAVPDAIEIACKARKVIKQNISIAVIYNALVLPVAFAGFVTPVIAAVAMSLSSIIVVANAMRLGRTKSTVTPLDHSAAAYALSQKLKVA